MPGNNDHMSGVGPLEIATATSDERWREIAKELQSDPEYRNYQTLKNLDLILKKLGINDVNVTGDLNLQNQLLRGEHNHTKAIIFSLSTKQSVWFDELTQPKAE